jgi:hypothetical protein
MGRDSGLVKRDGRRRRRPLRSAFALALALAAVLAASTLTTAAPAPQVRQPDDPSFSPEAQSALAKGLSTLESILGEAGWASGRTLGFGEWGARQFSFYTAGVLRERGYTVTVVATDNSATARSWLLVEIPLPGTVAWVPVEPSPDPGHPQRILGRIPRSGSVFASAYVTYVSVIPIPPNAAPIAVIRAPATRLQPNQAAALLALGSRDPDGVIVVYRWDFGDGTSAVFYDGNAVHTFAPAGNYTLTLTVIDNGGRSATATWLLAVGSGAPPASEIPKPNCGCGG